MTIESSGFHVIKLKPSHHYAEDIFKYIFFIRIIDFG